MPGELSLARRNTVRALIVLLLATSFLFATQPPPAEAGIRTAERRMAQMINRARAARGLPKLALRSDLTYRARTHSVRMARSGGIYHSNLRTTLRGISWRVAGENVGVGPSIRTLHTAFMRSSGHRANILYRRYRNVGVGVKWRSGVAWVTVIFTG